MAVGDIVPNGRGRWKLVAPTHCANGHRLSGGQVSFGTTACDCGHRHSTWFCRTCEHVTYGPALTSSCKIRSGPTSADHRRVKHRVKHCAITPPALPCAA